MSAPAADSIRPRARPKRRAWLSIVLRAALSAALLAWLLHTLHGAAARLDTLHPARLWPALAVLAVSTMLGALQWILILRHSGVCLPARRLLSLYWIGTFLNNFMLSNVGGDAVKVVDVALADGPGGLARALAGTLLDRLLGLVALMALAFVAAAALGGRAPAGLPWGVLWAACLPLVALLLALLSRRMAGVVVRALRRVGLQRLAGRVARVTDELRTFRMAPALLLRLLLLSLVVQATRVLTHLAVAAAMGMALPPARVLGLYVVVPVLGVVTTLPITFNGLGLRELAAARTMPALGLGPAEAVAMQLATYLVQVALSLIGGVLLALRLLRGQGRAPAAA